MNRLQGKTALITGGNSGIGLATAQEFIAQGARVIITGRDAAAVRDAVAALGEQARGIVSDASRMSDLRELAGQVRAEAAHLDILFVNAGVAYFAPVAQVDENHFDAQFAINVKGAYFTVQQLLPLLRDGSSIILNTSINASMGMPGSSVYAATKAALISLARTLSADLLERRIRVNAISPGPVSTPIYGKLGLPAEQLQGMAAGIRGQIPLKRFGEPAEIAKIAVFFASDDSSFVLGEELIAGGGMGTL